MTILDRTELIGRETAEYLEMDSQAHFRELKRMRGQINFMYDQIARLEELNRKTWQTVNIVNELNKTLLKAIIGVGDGITRTNT